MLDRPQHIFLGPCEARNRQENAPGQLQQNRLKKAIHADPDHSQDDRIHSAVSPMDVLRHWLIVLLGFGGLGNHASMAYRQPLLAGLGAGALLNWSGVLRTSIALADDLFLALAITRAAIWLFLEAPTGGLGLFPKSRDLLFVLISALFGHQPATTRPN